jgi:chemosensory pili system protein ChpA (sensor histidine kinase/response regulator)
VAPAITEGAVAPASAGVARAAPPDSLPQAPVTPTAPAAEAPGASVEDTEAIELTAAHLEELESIELPSALPAVAEVARAAEAASPRVADEEPTVEEELFEEPPVIEDAGMLAKLEVEAPPVEPEAQTAPAPVAQPAAPDRRTAERAEIARVDAGLLDALLNGAGEINIFQSRLTQQLHSIEFHLGELGSTVSRLRDQLRKLEAETEAQILHRHQDDVAGESGFDPLELDRYSTIQQLSRALAESANDVASINELLGGLTNETETLLTQQARVTAELQNGLMQTRMVPFQRHVARLARIVRQASADTGKLAELLVEGENNEIDRQVLESMLPPFEHLLRNAVAHGIEAPATRKQRGKPEVGRVTLKIKREGTEVLIEVADDGGGLDLPAIRRKGYEKGLLADGQKITDDQAIELILQPGFSTAGELTQTAGRGVGMDVVDNEVKKLGGSMRIESMAEQGTRFLIRLPYTLAITHALIVNVGEETFALPLPTVEGITRLSREKILKHLTEDEPKLDYGGITYRIQHLGSLVGGAPSALPDEESSVSLVLIRAGESSTALLTDSLEGSREIVVKTLGPHIASVAGVTGATILGDGRVIMILDPGTLVRAQRAPEPVPLAPPPAERELTALVVDDSITMRRVTQRLLERRGAKVLTARDGLDAITVLQEHEADIILLDIEMPRMDGYQFATHVRNDPKLKEVPIIMITSRSGEKHRAKAIEIGVNDYLSKPYQESQLVAAIEALLGRPL